MTNGVLFSLISTLTLIVIPGAACHENGDVPVTDDVSAIDRGWHELGRFAGTAQNPIGSISAVASDGADYAFVIDGIVPQVVRIDLDSGAEALVVRAGDGPGEVRDPSGIAYLGPGRNHFAVVDRIRRRIISFGVHGVDPIVSAEVPLPFAPNGICWLGNAYAVLGAHEGFDIHVVQQDGDLGEKFERTPGLTTDESQIIKRMMAHEWSEGFIVCPTRNLIVHAPARLGKVAIVERNRDSLVMVAIPDFVMPIRTARSSGVRFDIDPDVGFSNTVVGLVALCPNIIAISIRQNWPRNAERPLTVTVKTLDLRTLSFGNEFRANALVAVAGSLAFEREVEPEPALGVWRHPECKDDSYVPGASEAANPNHSGQQNDSAVRLKSDPARVR